MEGALNEAVKWKWIISVQSDLCAQIRTHQQPSARASYVFLISHCFFSQREGHLLIDCLNPLQINTAGSLCDAYPSSTLSRCLRQARGVRREGGFRLHQISPHFPTAVAFGHHIYFIVLCFLWPFLTTQRMESRMVLGIHAFSDALTLFMSCEMNRGYLRSQPDSGCMFQRFLRI